jgi:hypothetical protein
MRDDDKRTFAEVLRAVSEYYDRDPSASTVAMYWTGLRDLTIEQVRGAINAHVQDPKAGQFMPKIADLRRQIEAANDGGHPGPEEAWSIAMGARGEAASVVWTQQVATAFFQAAMPLLDMGDKVAARLAFVERYGRDMADARRAGARAHWFASLGTDPALRVQAVDQALRMGRITAEQADGLLPRLPGVIDVPALEASAHEAASPDDARRRIAQLKTLLRLP